MRVLEATGICRQLALEKISGSVGEALIMTAAGPAVALPAVFAANTLTRVNRVIMAGLDAFACDLHTIVTVGKLFVVIFWNAGKIAEARQKTGKS